ncbi:MAG TPA: hypothetical protein GX526_04130 [Thermoanaerobacterales bacterium]|nr:hypothetical protein [Thermoanaerobacterales bacterium]
MITGISHIGIVVKDIEKTIEALSRIMNVKEIYRKAFPEMGQTSVIIKVGDRGDKFELMEPIGDKGVVPEFLEKYGEGLHHISLDSDNLEEDCALLEKQNIKIIGKAKGIAFTHPKTTGGVLYEIIDGFDE